MQSGVFKRPPVKSGETEQFLCINLERMFKGV